MIQPIKIKFVLVNAMKTFVLLLVLFLNTGRTSAQGMEYWVDLLGDTSVPKGNTTIYSMPDFDLITNYGAYQILSFNWQVGGGKLKKVVNDASGNPVVIESSNSSYNSSYNNNDSAYYQWSETSGAEQLLSPDRVAVEWTDETGFGAMNCYIETDWDSYFGSLDVELTGLDTPNNPTITNVVCGQSTLNQSGTAPIDYEWYWQGKNPNGTSQSSLGSTFIANEGSGTYYIRARHYSGTWSERSGSVYVEISQTQKWYLDADKDGYGSSNYIESCADPSTTDTKYVSNNSDLNDSESLISLATQWCLDINGDGVITDIDTSYAHYNCVNSSTKPASVYGQNYIPTIVEKSHWIHSVSFNPDEFPIGSSRTYFDDLGKANISLSKDYQTNTIWGTETAYDNFGRADKTTFIAPSGYDHFVKTGFFTSSNGVTTSSYPSTLPLNNITESNDYKATQSITVTGTVSSGLNVNLTSPTITLSNGFTISATSGSNFTVTAANLPNVSGNQGLTSNYYTDANTLEPYQATAEQPYSQTNYDTLNPGNVINTVGGNRINGEWKTGYSYAVPAAQEMYYVYGSDYYDGAITAGKEEVITKFFKSVGVDANGVENVAFSDGEGKVLASARSGGATSYPVVSLIGTQGFVDVHIPEGITSGQISLIGSSSLYKVYNLKTGLLENGTLTGGNGYRIEAVTPPTVDPKVYISGGTPTYDSGALGINYAVNYYDYAVNVYNKTGQLIKSVQPNGFQLNSTVVAQPSYMASTATNFIAKYTYNDQGQLKQVESPDEGISTFAYRKDGQIRYSQSAKQRDTAVSYTDYDSNGRPIESGVIANNWAAAIADPDGVLISGNRSEQTLTIYDYVDNNQTAIAIPSNLFLNSLLTAEGIATADYTQNNLAGNVAVTYKADSGTITAISWYSYDIYGRAEWIAQYNEGLGIKTIHYTYDYKGNVSLVAFQKDKTTEQFMHRYFYDTNATLTKVQTATYGTPFITHADYSYYKTGELKRVNIAKGLQGLDYVYILGGQLKSINHPSLEAAKDPGSDANDVFGITLDYYSGDYLRTGRNITTSPNAGNDYNGNIKAARWANKSSLMDLSGSTINQKGYLYDYDRNNWLTGATFGNTSASTAAITTTASYKEAGLTYDANGNIKTLQRTNNAGTTVDNLTYNYTNAGKNQLNSVTENAAVTSDITDIENQNPDNYEYNTIGQMTRNIQENLYYFYNTQGLVTEVKKGSTTLVMFFYNERGQRIKKESYSNGNLQSTSYYALDLSGNTMAVYNKPVSGSIVQADLPIYGLSRLGVYNRAGAVSNYEITDHLGNVRAVIQKVNGNPIMQAYADYYPFGEQLPGRNSLSNYRYAFQGQELDGETGMEAFQLRLWDGRIGRWLSPDPYGEFHSPYLGMGNNPVSSIDPDGGKIEPSTPNIVESVQPEGIYYWNDVTGSYGFESSNSFWAKSAINQSNSFNYGGSAFGFGADFGAKNFTTNFDVRGFGANFGNYTSGGHLDLRAEVYGLKGSGQVTVGNDNFGFGAHASGSVFSAKANLDGGFITSSGNYGVSGGAEAGAYTAEGEYGGQASVLGATFKTTVGGSVFSAHIGGHSHLIYNNNKGTLEFTGLEHIGLGIGGKVAISGSIPIRSWYNLFVK